MSVIKYKCQICKKTTTQRGHLIKHLKSKMHIGRINLLKNKLKNTSDEKLILLFETSNHLDIINTYEGLNIKFLFLKKYVGFIKIRNKSQSKEIKKINNKERDELNKELKKINNREELKNLIHDIHNTLRNLGAGYGMGALKVFNLIYGLKKIEDLNLLTKVGLSDNCKFSKLIEMLNSDIINKNEHINNQITSVIQREIHSSDIEFLSLIHI